MTPVLNRAVRTRDESADNKKYLNSQHKEKERH